MSRLRSGHWKFVIRHSSFSMRVLFGSFSAITVLGGGVEVQMRCLARELGKLGVEVELFDPWKRYDLKDYAFFHLFGSHVGTYHLGRSIHGLGMRAKKASAFIVMAIMGGAILPKLMGHVGDLYGMSRAFVVPLGCFAFVSLYGYAWPKLSKCESMTSGGPMAGH